MTLSALKSYGLIALLVVTVSALRLYGVEHERLGAEKVLRRQADSVNKILVARGDSVEKVYLTDTLKLRVLQTKLVTLTDTLFREHRITDTLFVERVIQVQDSTIHACVSALQTCEAAKNILRAQVSEWKYVAEHPIPRSCFLPAAEGGLLGAALTFTILHFK